MIKWISDKLFKKILLSYLILVVLLMTITFISGKQSVDEYKNNFLSNRIEQFEYTRNRIDEKCKSVYHSFEQLTSNNDFRKMLFDIGNENSRVVDEMLLMENLRGYIYPLTSAKEIFVYFKQRDCIVSSQGVYPVEGFYETHFKYGDMTEDEFKSKFLQGEHIWETFPVKETFFSNSTSDNMIIIHSYPPTVKNPSAIIFALMGVEQFSEVLELDSLYSGSSSAILDGNGNILASSYKNFEIKSSLLKENSGYEKIKVGNQDNFLIYTKSNYNQWGYVSVISEEIFLKEVKEYSNQTMWFLTIALLIGLFLAFCLTVVNVPPIQRVINELINENRNLSKETKIRLEQMKNDFFFRILKGGFNTNTQIESYMDALKINFEGSSFTVIVIKSVDNGYAYYVDSNILNETISVNIRISEEIKKLDVTSTVVAIDDNAIAAIFAMDGREESRIKNIAETLVNMLNSQYNINVSIALGETYEGKMGIFYSYIDAMETHEYMKSVKQTGVLNHKDIPRNQQIYYYPLELEQQIINFVQVGETEETRKIIEKLYYENFIVRHPDIQCRKFFKNALMSTVFKIVESHFKSKDKVIQNIVNMVEKPEETDSLEQSFSETCDIFIQLSEIIQLEKTGNERHLKREIEAYINDNFTSYKISRAVMAEHFHLSEAYFSRLFKEIFSKSFSSFLEGKRIEYAANLLLSENFTINEIAIKTGYVEVQVFRRAFKRVKNLTPSEFREKYR